MHLEHLERAKGWVQIIPDPECDVEVVVPERVNVLTKGSINDMLINIGNSRLVAHQVLEAI